ncbi:hypothetical protein KDL29_04070 [bacterium]|nr:hypothetical protein [bacterium]
MNVSFWKVVTDNLFQTFGVLGFAGILAWLAPFGANWVVKRVIQDQLSQPLQSRVELIVRIATWCIIGAVVFVFYSAKSNSILQRETMAVVADQEMKIKSLTDALSSQFYCRIDNSGPIKWNDTPNIEYRAIEIGPTQADWEQCYVWIPKSEASKVREVVVRAKGGYHKSGMVYGINSQREAPNKEYIELTYGELVRGNSVYIVTSSPLSKIQFGSHSLKLNYKVLWDEKRSEYIEEK